MKKNPVILISVQAMWGSIEWILPACKYLKDNYNGIVLLFLIQRRRKKEIFRDNSKLETLVNEFSTQRCLDLSDISPVWIRSISDLFYFFEEKWPGRLFSKIGNFWFNRNWIFFGKTILEKWTKGIKPDICLMDSRSNKLFDILKDNGINTGFYLTSPSFSFSPDVWVDRHKHRLMCSDSSFDFFLVDTKWAADFFKDIAPEKPVFQVGCPKFDTFWMEHLKKRGSGHPGQTHDAGNKRNVLVFLCNESSLVFSKIRFTDSLNEIISACTNINNISITVKPHPRQDLLLLNEIINSHSDAAIEISNEPSFALINKADIIIAMPTGVIIDALIAGRPVIEYFNYVELNKLLREEFGQIPRGAFGGMGYIDEEGHLSSVFRELGFVLKADNRDELTPVIQKVFSNNYSPGKNDIRNIFPEGASKKAAEAVMSFENRTTIV